LILDSADSIIETIDKKKAVCKEGQRRPCSIGFGQGFYIVKYSIATTTLFFSH
jgi:hypothetical protein